MRKKTRRKETYYFYLIICPSLLIYSFFINAEYIFSLKNDFPQNLLFSSDELRSMGPMDAYCYEAESVYYGNELQDEFRFFSDLLK